MTHRRCKGDVFKQLLRTFAHRYKSFMMSPGIFSLAYEHCREIEMSMLAFSYTIDNFCILIRLLDFLWICSPVGSVQAFEDPIQRFPWLAVESKGSQPHPHLLLLLHLLLHLPSEPLHHLLHLDLPLRLLA